MTQNISTPRENVSGGLSNLQVTGFNSRQGRSMCCGKFAWHHLVQSLGTSVIRAGDAVKRAALRSNLRAMADMLIDPQSVELIRNANNRGASIGIADALGRSVAEAGGTLYGR